MFTAASAALNVDFMTLLVAGGLGLEGGSRDVVLMESLGRGSSWDRVVQGEGKLAPCIMLSFYCTQADSPCSGYFKSQP
jgi:hypothetical protein